MLATRLLPALALTLIAGVHWGEAMSTRGTTRGDVKRQRPVQRPVEAVDSADAGRSSRSASSANDRWLEFMSDYIRGSTGLGNSPPGWPKGTQMVDLPVARDGSGRPSSVPVLVLPVPVPVRDSSQECPVNRDREDNPYDGTRPTRPAQGQPSYEDARRPHGRDPASRPDHRAPARQHYQYDHRDQYDLHDLRDQQDYYDEPYDRQPQATPPRRPVPGRAPAPGPPPVSPHVHPDIPNIYQEARNDVPPPTMPDSNSRVLLELFRAQQPSAPHLPPVLIRDRRFAEPRETGPPRVEPTTGAPPPRARAPPAPPPAPAGARTHTSAPRSPPAPRFDRPLILRGDLTVHRADYTEPYTAWWDPSTGNTRVDLHDGATNIYRNMRGGQLHRASMSVDRTGEAETTRCAVAAGRAPAAADRLPPLVPDMQPFVFDGYEPAGASAAGAERWRHAVAGRAGELGAARGEALTYRHLLLLQRGHNSSALPVMYSVGVDSSVLGEDCDGYVIRYHEVYEHQPDPSLFTIDVDSACGVVEQTSDARLVDPLREFTLTHRDPSHDQHFQEYVKEFERKYADNTEEAIRKNLWLQSSRFVSAGNRVGATFKMALNFLSDRLDAELSSLLGVVLDDEHFPAEAFPHERAGLRQLADQLPDEFDWRTRGGVTPVRYQGSCSSCWAFAVTGAVEGALFRQTRRLVALSEQSLVDCAQPYGGRGCGGTWPSHAYDYIQDRGIPAQAEYIPYQARVLECQDKRVKPVTQISAHVNVTQHSVSALKVAISEHAPTVVIIDAMLKSFQTYKSGVFYDDRCAKTKGKLKHAVLAVGWGSQRDEPHFILKNSWSSAWGDGGYMRMHGPSNTCGVLTLPSYPRLEHEDVLRLPTSASAASAARA